MKRLKLEGIPGPGAKIYSSFTTRNPFMKDFYREVVNEVSASLVSGSLLDIGTGPGYIPLDIAQRSPGLEIKAIDISQAMVDLASKNASRSGLGARVQFNYGSADRIPYADEHFDLVISTLSLHHWANPTACFKEVHRVLKTGGEAWIYDIQWDVTKQGREQLNHKYGRLVAAVMLYFVRLHSSVTAHEIKDLISSLEPQYSAISAEDRGLILKLRLSK